MVSIDFTASNKDPRTDNTSLHRIDRTGAYPNQYELAVMQVGAVLEVYDTDKWFPAYG